MRLAARLPAAATAYLALAGAALIFAGQAAAAPASPPTPDPASYPVHGIDVSHHNGAIDWWKVSRSGIRFAFIKATESTDFADPQFQTNYRDAGAALVIRSAYHFAHPDLPARAQVEFFLAHGGDQSPGPLTLPGSVDLESNPVDNGEGICYGRTPDELITWTTSFAEDYRVRTGRYPILYVSAGWWRKCVGSSTALDGKTPLWVQDLDGPVSLPSGFGQWAFRQYSWTGTVPGVEGSPGAVDLDVWHGSYVSLLWLASKPH